MLARCGGEQGRANADLFAHAYNDIRYLIAALEEKNRARKAGAT